MKAMILAAGRGERMRGAFGGRHKSLLELDGQTMIARLARQLTAAGFSPLVINVCHKADEIISECGDGSRFGNQISYSREDSALETAGGIANALPLLGEEPFLAANSDIYSEIDFSALRSGGLRSMDALGTLAHLALVPNPEHNPSGDFSLQGGLVRRPGEVRDLTYSGVGLFSPQAFADIARPSKVPLIEVLEPLVREKKVGGERVPSFWRDVGTPERYEDLRSRFAQRGQPTTTTAKER